VAASILEAIKAGIWDFEPEDRRSGIFQPTEALPGTNEKLEVMASRVRLGLPLWHPDDRRTFDRSDVFDIG
jgi:hypothetical protein